MTYEVVLTPTAEADLRRLDSAVARRAIDKMQWLANNIETIRLETLTGSWQGVFKLRVGGLPDTLHSRSTDTADCRPLHQASTRGIQETERLE